jgi:hypothetical protein
MQSQKKTKLQRYQETTIAKGKSRWQVDITVLAQKYWHKGGGDLSVTLELVLPWVVPARNCYVVTGDLSRGNKLPNAFP